MKTSPAAVAYASRRRRPGIYLRDPRCHATCLHGASIANWGFRRDTSRTRRTSPRIISPQSHIVLLFSYKVEALAVSMKTSQPPLHCTSSGVPSNNISCQPIYLPSAFTNDVLDLPLLLGHIQPPVLTTTRRYLSRIEWALSYGGQRSSPVRSHVQYEHCTVLPLRLAQLTLPELYIQYHSVTGGT